jgi:hypothetical protein
MDSVRDVDPDRNRSSSCVSVSDRNSWSSREVRDDPCLEVTEASGTGRTSDGLNLPPERTAVAAHREMRAPSRPAIGASADC